MTIDLTTELGQRVTEQLTDADIIWLTTLKPDGTPEPNPVWFYWNGSTVLIRSRDDFKLRNLATDPRAVLHFNTDANGSNVAVIHGIARTAGDETFAPIRNAYAAKYARRLTAVSTSLEQMLADYHNTVVIEPTRLRGW